MRRLAWVVGVVTLLATASYLFVYVYRWEWHRALLVGVLFLAALVGLSAALVLRRLAQLEQRMAARPLAEDRALAALRSAPVAQPPFRWLQPQLDRTHIFIPVLLGGGVLVSGLAWLVERVAGGTARAGVESELAQELAGIGFPRSALVPTRAEALACDARFADDAGVRLLLAPGSVAGGP